MHLGQWSEFLNARVHFLFAVTSLVLCFGMGTGSSDAENNSKAVMELLLVIITDETGSYPQLFFVYSFLFSPPSSLFSLSLSLSTTSEEGGICSTHTHKVKFDCTQGQMTTKLANGDRSCFLQPWHAPHAGYMHSTCHTLHINYNNMYIILKICR